MFIVYPDVLYSTKITDWISAFCNILMAGAAFGGYYIAKNWQKQKMDEDAYQLFKKIVLHNYRNIANVYSDLYTWLDYYSVIIASLPDRGKNHMPNIDKVNGFFEQLQGVFNLRQELEDNILYIEKLGWKLKPELMEFNDQFSLIAFKDLYFSMHTALASLDVMVKNIDIGGNDLLMNNKEEFMKALREVKINQVLLDDKYDFFKNFSDHVNGYFVS